MNKDIDNTDLEEETVATQDKKEKLLTQEEVNKLLAKERRDWKSKLENLQEEYNSYRGEVETKQSEITEKMRKKVETLKKDQPEQVIKLLDKLSVEEQLEYLEDESNQLTEKKKIPATPDGKDRDSKPQKTLSITRF